MNLKKTMLTGATAALMALGGVAAISTSASAYIVCNREGDCWHADRREHPRGLRFNYHSDDYYFHRRWEDDREHRWRGENHEGRGYWRNGVWLSF
jgi:hypothetical protein